MSACVCVGGGGGRVCGGGAHSALNRLHASDVAWTSTSAGQNIQETQTKRLPKLETQGNIVWVHEEDAIETDRQTGRQAIRQQSLSQ